MQYRERKICYLYRKYDSHILTTATCQYFSRLLFVHCSNEAQCFFIL